MREQTNFRDYLNHEIEAASRRFETAKEEIIREIKTMSIFDAHFYGAAYASHTEKLTAAAAELETLHKIFRRYEFFTGESCEAEDPVSSIS